MNISAINSANQNFGKFIAWRNRSGGDLTNQEIRMLDNLKMALDCKQAKHIDIIGMIGYGTKDDPDVKSVRFITAPLEADMSKIRNQRQHANATVKEYERSSKWIPMNSELKYRADNFIDKQINYIRYCITNPNHTTGFVNKKHYYQ